MTHLEAVERAIADARPLLTTADDPLLELLRSLARQVDDCGDKGPGTRLAATYLTSVRTLLTLIRDREKERREQGPSRAGKLAELQRLRQA